MPSLNPELPQPRLSPQRLAVLGSTGSIGTQTLEVAAAHPDKLQVSVLSAGNNIELLIRQIDQFQPDYVSVATEEGWRTLLEARPAYRDKSGVGLEGLVTAATHEAVDTVVVGLVGSVGLRPTLAALEANKTVATANKETLVAGGCLLQPYLGQILPVDSEHSALFQALQGNRLDQVQTLWLTASGGAFREKSLDELQHVTVQQALKHPNWVMGAKVTVDSATLMNKGLEVIEAHTLFGLPASQIDVVIHPDSIIHSAVEYVDGSIMAQLSTPDMRQPIQYALSHPHRWEAPYLTPQKRLKLTELSQLTFAPPDLERFRCLALAFEALELGPGACVALNAANEVAVERFIAGKVAFLEIPELVREALTAFHQEANWQRERFDSVEAIEAVDTWARSLNTSCL